MEPRFLRHITFILVWVLYHTIPKPNVAFFINVDHRIAFNRKDDIPSITYLANLSQTYLALVPTYDIKVINGSADLGSLLIEVLKYLPMCQ